MELLVEDHQEQIGGIDHTRRVLFNWLQCIPNVVGAMNSCEGLLLRMVSSIIITKLDFNLYIVNQINYFFAP
jgi:hypothetical protein